MMSEKKNRIPPCIKRMRFYLLYRYIYVPAVKIPFGIICVPTGVYLLSGLIRASRCLRGAAFPLLMNGPVYVALIDLPLSVTKFVEMV